MHESCHTRMSECYHEWMSHVTYERANVANTHKSKHTAACVHTSVKLHMNGWVMSRHIWRSTRECVDTRTNEPMQLAATHLNTVPHTYAWVALRMIVSCRMRMRESCLICRSINEWVMACTNEPSQLAARSKSSSPKHGVTCVWTSDIIYGCVTLHMNERIMSRMKEYIWIIHCTK